MTYCKKCTCKECSYIEIKEFIDYLNDIYDSEYKLNECLDKSKLDFTSDMILSV